MTSSKKTPFSSQLSYFTRACVDRLLAKEVCLVAFEEGLEEMMKIFALGTGKKQVVACISGFDD